MLKRNLSSSTKSVSHKSAVDAKLAADQKQQKEQSPIERELQKMDGWTLQKMDKLFQTAFYAWKERAFTDFPNFLALQTLNRVGLWGTNYHNDKAAKEFISHIAGVYQDDLQKHFHELDYFSVYMYCDGSTDRSESEKKLVMVRVIEDF